MKTYTEIIEDKSSIINLQFTGPDSDNYFKEHNNLFTSMVTLKDKIRNTDIWTRINENIPVPSQAWNGHKLLTTIGNRIYLGIGNELHEINKQNGHTIWKNKYTDGAIEKIQTSSDNQTIFVLYSWTNCNKTKPNFYCIDLVGKILWFITRDDDSSVVTNFEFNGSFLTAWTFDCLELKINNKTGEIYSKIFTK